MRPIAYALPSLPGLTAIGTTYAAWPVWRDSARGEVRFAPVSKKEAARRWHKARRFERQTHEPGKHGGAIGRSGLAVLYALLFEFLDYASGRLDPSYDAIAAKAGVCRRTAVAAVARLKDLGLLAWQRRCREDKDADGRSRLAQETNAYCVLPPSSWRGWHEPPAPPPPDPAALGCPERVPEALEAATAIIASGGPAEAVLAMLGSDPKDKLARALAELGRAMLDRGQ